MIATKRIYIDAAGRVCEEGAPEVSRLLVGAGCYLPDSEAARYGLLPGEPAPEAQAPAAPPRDKAVRIMPRGSRRPR